MEYRRRWDEWLGSKLTTTRPDHYSAAEATVLYGQVTRALEARGDTMTRLLRGYRQSNQTATVGHIFRRFQAGQKSLAQQVSSYVQSALATLTLHL